MKFETITEKEIMTMAWHTLLNKWMDEMDREKGNPDDVIAKVKKERYRKQLNEVEARLKELEAEC